MSTTNEGSTPAADGSWRSRWRLTYTAGDWLALAGPSAAVLLQPASGHWSELIGTIWEDVLAAGSIEDLLERMAAFRLEGMPSFAALFWGPDGLRSLARGRLRLLDADTGAVLLDGSGVQTWSEAALGSVTRVRITPAGTEASGGELRLPLVIGAAGVAELVVETAPERLVGTRQGGSDATAVSGTLPGAAGAEGAPVADGPADGGFEGSDSLTDAFAAVPVRSAADRSLGSSNPAQADPATEGEGPDEGQYGYAGLAASLPGASLAPAAEAPVEDDESESGHTVLAPNLPGRPVLAPPASPPAAPPAPPRRVAAVLRPSSGGRVEVDRPVLIGRAPSANRVSGGQLPRLLTVPSPSHDISRTHLQVAPDDGRVLVTDMNSTNGTIVISASGRRLTLEPSAPEPIEPGAVIDLGDGVTIAVEPPGSEPPDSDLPAADPGATERLGSDT